MGTLDAHDKAVGADNERQIAGFLVPGGGVEPP